MILTGISGYGASSLLCPGPTHQFSGAAPGSHASSAAGPAPRRTMWHTPLCCAPAPAGPSAGWPPGDGHGHAAAPLPAPSPAGCCRRAPSPPGTSAGLYLASGWPVGGRESATDKDPHTPASLPAKAGRGAHLLPLSNQLAALLELHLQLLDLLLLLVPLCCCLLIQTLQVQLQVSQVWEKRWPLAQHRPSPARCLLRPRVGRSGLCPCYFHWFLPFRALLFCSVTLTSSIFKSCTRLWYSSACRWCLELSSSSFSSFCSEQREPRLSLEPYISRAPPSTPQQVLWPESRAYLPEGLCGDYLAFIAAVGAAVSCFVRSEVPVQRGQRRLLV